MHTHAVDADLPDLAQRHPGDRWPTVERTGDSDAWLNFGGQRYRRIDDRCWSPSARLVDMDRDGIAVQVISPIPVTFCYQADVAAAAELAVLQNDSPASSPSTRPGSPPSGRYHCKTRIWQSLNCATVWRVPVSSGWRLAPRSRIELSDETFDRFFAVAHELGALVLVHPSDQDLLARTTSVGLGFGAGMPIETGLAAAALIGSGALARRPGVRLCLAHGAGALPSLIGRMDKGALIAGVAADSAELPSRQAAGLWCDSLTYNRSALDAVIELFGQEHVVFGSDYPFPRCPNRSTTSSRTYPPNSDAESAEPMWRHTMAHFLALGLTHYPLLAGTDEHMASLLRWTLTDPDIPRRKGPGQLVGGDARRMGRRPGDSPQRRRTERGWWTIYPAAVKPSMSSSRTSWWSGVTTSTRTSAKKSSPRSACWPTATSRPNRSS